MDRSLSKVSRLTLLLLSLFECLYLVQEVNPLLVQFYDLVFSLLKFHLLRCFNCRLEVFEVPCEVEALHLTFLVYYD